MKIAMIASNYFPIRDVSSIRIHSYCKALAKIGVEVTVLIVYPSNGENTLKEGVYEGVNFRFVTDERLYLRGNLFKLYSRIRGLIFVNRFVKENKIDAVLTYHDNLLSSVFIKLFKYSEWTPFIIDKTEYPYGYFRMSPIKRQIVNWNLGLFTGFIVISKELKQFYSKYSRNVFMLPMTIDPNRFEGIVRDRQTVPYIAITFGTHNRDGLYDSIQAYNNYVKLSGREAMKLFLIGDFEELCKKFPECEKILKYVSDNNLTDLVVFMGRIPIDAVPRILADARCLLTTPVQFESGGFPTKLGEYMLSGVPVVATNAGEISEYVKHRYDIFLSNVGDIEDIAQNILFVQENADFSNNIGLNAMITAQTKFNANTYANDLLEFIIKNAK